MGSDAGVPEEAERCGGSPGLLQRPVVKLSSDRGEWSPAWICSFSIITFAHAHNHDCNTTWLKFSWSKCELIYLPMKHQSNFSVFLFSLKAKPRVVVLLTLVLRPHLTCPRLIFLFPTVRELLTVNGNFQLALCKSSCKIDQWNNLPSLLPRHASILCPSIILSSHILHKMILIAIQQCLDISTDFLAFVEKSKCLITGLIKIKHFYKYTELDQHDCSL